jgi:hypothetical protein
MKAILVALAFVVASCTTTPKTPKESVAACYASVTATANTAADIDARGKLPPAVKAKVKEGATQALQACDTARAALAAGDLKTVDGSLAVATSLLATLEATLGAK